MMPVTHSICPDHSFARGVGLIRGAKGTMADALVSRRCRACDELHLPKIACFSDFGVACGLQKRGRKDKEGASHDFRHTISSECDAT